GWARDRREEVHQRWLALLIGLAALHEARGEHRPGIALLERAVAAEPSSEAAHRALLRLYALSGDRRRALRHYGLLGKLLERDLGTPPDAATRDLHDAILAGRFPPPPTSGLADAPD